MKIANFFSRFKRDQKIQQIAIISTFKTKKEFKAYLQCLEKTLKKAKMLERGLHGGGCPAPDAIIKPGWFDNL
ncbi:hypothetical protein KAU19_01965 [Candidatus Parcubacteria bacterium]|nr:hypothetical protein [Candidatus Parcubacteria bacterium]